MNINSSVDGDAAVPAVIPTMDNRHLPNIPLVLRQGRRFRNWRWMWDPQQGRLTKRPWHPGSGFRFNGHSLKTAVTWSEALALACANTGVGLVTGELAGVRDWTVFDLDFKGYVGPRFRDHPEAQHGPATAPLLDLPVGVAWFVWQVVQHGGYAELSPSGQGVRLILPGTLTPGHATRWTFGEYLWGYTTGDVDEALRHAEGIGGEVYTARRWLTLTGQHLHGHGVDTAALPLEETEETRSFLQEFREHFLPARHRPGSGADLPDLDTAQRPVKVGVEALTGSLGVFRGPGLRALWEGQVPDDRSRGDLRLCLTLFELLGDDPVGVNATFLSSGRWRPKWRRVHVGGQTYGAATVARAQKRWHERGRRQLVLLGQVAAPLDWPPGAQQALRRVILGQAKGTSAQRQAMLRVLGALLACLESGAFHLHGGLAHLHTGGMRALIERTGGNTAMLRRRLAWLVKAGFLESFEQDDEGRPRVAVAASHHNCRALRDGLASGEPLPAAPSRNRGSAAREDAQKKRPEPRRETLWRRTEATLGLILEGERDVRNLSERSRQGQRTVRQHLRELQAAGVLGADHTPLISEAHWRAAVEQERARGQQRTREHRQQATERYRHLISLRGTRQPSAARQAEQAAWDAACDQQAGRQGHD